MHRRLHRYDSPVGKIAKAAPGLCSGGDDKPWELKTLQKSAVSLVASPAGDGRLVAGIEMGFGGQLAIYLTKFRAQLRE